MSLEYDEYSNNETELISCIRFFMHTITSSTSGSPYQLLGSISDMVFSLIDTAVRSDPVSEEMIVQLERLTAIMFYSSESSIFSAMHSSAFSSDFLSFIPTTVNPSRMGTSHLEAVNDPNPQFPKTVDELIERLLKWSDYLKELIQHTSVLPFLPSQCRFLWSILPQIEVPGSYNRLITPHIQSAIEVLPNIENQTYRWNIFRIIDDMSCIHYFSLIQKLPMDMVYSMSAISSIQFFSRLFENDPLYIKRIGSLCNYNCIPMDGISLFVERQMNEVSLREIMRTILKKKGVELEDLMLATMDSYKMVDNRNAAESLEEQVEIKGEFSDYMFVQYKNIIHRFSQLLNVYDYEEWREQFAYEWAVSSFHMMYCK